MNGELLKAKKKKQISSMAVDAESKRNFLIFSSYTKKQSPGKNKIINQTCFVKKLCANALHNFHLSQQN